MSEIVLSANEATVRHGSSIALHPVTLTAERGQWWCITGPNGSGKTTLLRALSGRLPLSGGSCAVLGLPIDMTQSRQRRWISSLVEPIPIARDLTLREQVAMVAASWLAGGDVTDERVVSTLSELGLVALQNRFPHELSSGQLQLFNLALVMVRPCEVLLLDEPERHLDASRTARLAELLADRTAHGTTIITATHSTQLIDACGRHVELR